IRVQNTTAEPGGSIATAGAAMDGTPRPEMGVPAVTAPSRPREDATTRPPATHAITPRRASPTATRASCGSRAGAARVTGALTPRPEATDAARGRPIRSTQADSASPVP